VRRSHVAGAAHFGEADFDACLRQLPGGFRTGEAAADYVNLMIWHCFSDLMNEMARKTRFARHFLFSVSL
jgi:hypothetical protein